MEVEADNPAHVEMGYNQEEEMVAGSRDFAGIPHMMAQVQPAQCSTQVEPPEPL